MANKQVQFRRGTTLDNDMFTGADGEITVDTDSKNIRLHDGITQGGHKISPDSQNAGGGGGSSSGQYFINDFQSNWVEAGTKFGWTPAEIGAITFGQINFVPVNAPAAPVIIEAYAASVQQGLNLKVGEYTLGTDGSQSFTSAENGIPADELVPVAPGQVVYFQTTAGDDNLIGVAMTFVVSPFSGFPDPVEIP